MQDNSMFGYFNECINDFDLHVSSKMHLQIATYVDFFSTTLQLNNYALELACVELHESDD